MVEFPWTIITITGGILRIAGIAMTPRIILMTDGQPTDSAGEEEVRQPFQYVHCRYVHDTIII